MPMALAHKSTIMHMAVKTSTAPRSSSRWVRKNRRMVDTRRTYEVGVESWRTFVDERLDGMMTPKPGSSGNSGEEA